MAEITSLSTLVKGSVNLQDYFVVANTTTKKARRLQVNSLFASLSTLGTGSEQLYSGIAQKNQLNFKGIKSGDTGLLTVATVTDNIVLTVLEAGIDLSLCNNSSSGFISTVDLSKASNTLGVAYGGTGLTSFVKGHVLYASDTGTIATTGLTSNGQLLIGNASTGVPNAGTLASADSSITITNSAGGIDLAVAATSSLATTLDCGIYNINLNDGAGNSFVSGDGTAEGIHVDSTGYVFIGDSTPTIPTLTSQVTLGGNATNAITIGNINNYADRTIKFQDASGTNDGLDATIRGADASGTNKIGGDLTVTAGSGTNTTAGGNLSLQGGGNSGSSGKGGALYLQTANASNTQTTALTVAGTTQAISIAKDTTFNSGVNLTMNASGAGAIKPGGGGLHHGAVVHHDTNNTGQTSAVVWGDGDSNDTIKLDLVEAFDLHFLASTSAPTTMYYVWGWTAGITPVTIAD